MASTPTDHSELRARAEALNKIDCEYADFPIVEFRGRRVHIDNVLLYASNDIISLLDQIAAYREALEKIAYKKGVSSIGIARQALSPNPSPDREGDR